MCGVLNCVRGVHPLVNHHKPPPMPPTRTPQPHPHQLLAVAAVVAAALLPATESSFPY